MSTKVQSFVYKISQIPGFNSLLFDTKKKADGKKL
jgi:hypothetical protein